MSELPAVIERAEEAKPSAATSPNRIASLRSYWLARLSGICFCLLLVLGASYIADHYGSSKILGALLLGMAFNSISNYPEFAPGLDFCAKQVLRIGVALLGVRITFSQISELGLQPLMVVAAVVVATIVFSIVLAHLLKVDVILGVISGAAVGICGASAALAVAAVLPGSSKSEKHLLCTVVGVAGLSTICMVLYPGLLLALGMTPAQMGLFLGASIHDVAQVFGAGDMISPAVAQLATYTKMLRVAMLVPVIMILAVLFSANTGQGRIRRMLPPPFLMAFVGFVILANVNILPQASLTWFSSFSQICLWTAMAALGAKTNLVELWHVGRKPFVLLLVNTIFIAGLSFLLVL